jgi:hypothetical protein
MRLTRGAALEIIESRRLQTVQRKELTVVQFISSHSFDQHESFGTAGNVNDSGTVRRPENKQEIYRSGSLFDLSMVASL